MPLHSHYILHFPMIGRVHLIRIGGTIRWARRVRKKQYWLLSIRLCGYETPVLCWNRALEFAHKRMSLPRYARVFKIICRYCNIHNNLLWIEPKTIITNPIRDSIEVGSFFTFINAESAWVIMFCNTCGIKALYTPNTPTRRYSYKRAITRVWRRWLCIVQNSEIFVGATALTSVIRFTLLLTFNLWTSTMTFNLIGAGCGVIITDWIPTENTKLWDVGRRTRVQGQYREFPILLR